MVKNVTVYKPSRPDFEILDSIWWNPADQSGLCIGVVAVTSGRGWKAYIGYGNGYDELADALHIKTHGVPFGHKLAKAAFPSLDPKEFIS